MRGPCHRPQERVRRGKVVASVDGSLLPPAALDGRVPVRRQGRDRRHLLQQRRGGLPAARRDDGGERGRGARVTLLHQPAAAGGGECVDTSRRRHHGLIVQPLHAPLLLALHRVPPVLDGAVCPAGEGLDQLGPARAVQSDSLDDGTILLRRPLLLAHVGGKVVEPTLPALLRTAPLHRGTNLTPLCLAAAPARLDEGDERCVLLLCPDLLFCPRRRHGETTSLGLFERI
mmetsp:Transcript_39590/g.131990  ORF Transcript_39590/g.131990 Transcript_39590/m.131990 type:complete len:230 (-) Transcript_39590:69-758(-)